VAEVNYPGLASHPDHEHAAELLSGFGGMLSLRLAGGTAATDRLLDGLRIPTVAPASAASRRWSPSRP
jgi:cystathionine beta-lyase/cystathionine gamma-synthase